MDFDPDAAALPGSGLFGLPHTPEESGVVVIPISFDATASYGGGAADGPRAIRAASAQVDLYDHQFGRVYAHGIHMLEEDPVIRVLSDETRRLARPIIERGGATEQDAEAVRLVDESCEKLNDWVFANAMAVLRQDKVAAVVGGDHSTPFGLIRACADVYGSSGIGVLQIDAHMDLREAYEGFEWSHASIMWNVLSKIPQVKRLVQVGIRDYAEGELRAAERFGVPQIATHDSWVIDSGPGRVATHFDMDWAQRMDKGEPFGKLCQQAVDALPRYVYVSFDIDGLEPSLCPHTGTPVPGGLSFNRACVLLEALWRSGRTVVGFDLCEVAPGPGGGEWDANVAARILYKLCGCACATLTEA